MTWKHAGAGAPRRFGAFVLAAISLGCTAERRPAANGPPSPPAPSAISRTLLLRKALPNLPGWETRLYLIEYAPGVAAPAHYHPVEGLGYVVSGRFESAFQGEAPVVVNAGQSFVERAGVAHVLFRNPDPLRSLKFVIAFVAAHDAPVVVAQ